MQEKLEKLRAAEAKADKTRARHRQVLEEADQLEIGGEDDDNFGGDGDVMIM